MNQSSNSDESAVKATQASRRGVVAPFIVMDVMQSAARLEREGRDIVHMEVGQPGTPAPRLAREAVTRALNSGAPTGYTVALGLPELREKIAARYRRWNGLDIAPERVIVTNGSSGAFLLAFLALFDAGDKVALADPGYPSYRNILRSLDIEVARIEAEAASGFQITPEALRALGPVKGVLTASPANPTGATLSRAALEGLIRIAEAQGTAFISDEIYDGLFYGERPASALEISDDVIVINSFSKYYSMTGWRIGWMVAPPGMTRMIERLAQNHFICPPAISQIAALAAMEAEDELEGHLRVYARNREILLDALPDMGISRLAPADGAFYIYADIADFTDDSAVFCARLLNEAGVATTPGVDFDPMRGGRFMRLSFAETTARIEEGARRMKGWLAKGV